MMDVWDPKDKTTVLSQLKTLIEARIEAFRVSRYLHYPGKWLYEWFLKTCENYGGSISCWAWHRRWNKGVRRKWKDD
jgi:hypothetical protein